LSNGRVDVYIKPDTYISEDDNKEELNLIKFDIKKDAKDYQPRLINTL
jgi:hypothetical protein